MDRQSDRGAADGQTDGRGATLNAIPYEGPHNQFCHFYRAMHFSAKRGIAIACRLSLRPSVCDVGEL